MYDNIAFDGVIISEKGNVRIQNQDNAYMNGRFCCNIGNHRWMSMGRMCGNFYAAVFDGMGGMQDGEVASRMAAEELMKMDKNDIWETKPQWEPDQEEIYTRSDNFQKSDEDEKDDSLNSFLDRYAVHTNRLIAQEGNGRNMGTTCTILAMEDGQFTFANLGDSTGYLYRMGILRKLTREHNMVKEMVRNGVITKKQAKNHPDRHALSQYLGMKEGEDVFAPEMYMSKTRRIHLGDIYMLCTDGLTDVVEGWEIRSILSRRGSLYDKAEWLINQALKNGGKDNVTVLLVEVVRKEKK